MLVIKDIQEWLKLQASSEVGPTLGFVPTMGALHKGHLSLVNRSIQENDKTVVSIFLNPTQFNDPKDLSGYPQTLNDDLVVLEKAGVNAVLLPSFSQIYPDNYRYKLIEEVFSRKLCGATRPGHFDGVLTVVMKLLNIVQATQAYFGEKDYQQFVLIKEMAEAFFLRTKIISCPTIREHDGLAYSSRNARLTPKERNLAPHFHEVLTQKLPLDSPIHQLESKGFRVDYLEELNGRRYGAVYLGKVRLIDNVAI